MSVLNINTFIFQKKVLILLDKLYIYILSSTDTISLYHNSSVWLDMLDSQSWD